MAEFDKFLDDPTLFLNRIYLSKGTVEFISANRAAIVHESFLNDHADRTQGIWATRVNAPLNGIMQAMAKRAPMRDPDAFIFHTAMAGSTLLARCLDAPGKALSIKEPQALGDLINAKRMGEAQGVSPAQWTELVRFTGRMLAKTAGPGEKVVIKNSNKANALITDIHSAFPGAKVLLLYSAMQPFMISMLRRGQPSWEYCRNLLKALFADAGGADQKTLWNALEFTDLQIAPIVWHMQFDVLANFLAKSSPARAKSLDCETFFASPQDTLARAAEYFGVEFNNQEVDVIAQREVMGRHAKDLGKTYNPETRAQEHRDALKQYARELEFVTTFSRKIRPDVDVSRKLTNPL